MTWIVRAFNENRKLAVNPSWLLCIDESMVAWTGQGCPHQPFVPRKPEPLGVELKDTCDGDTGVMLFIEVQDNKVIHHNV